VEEGYNNNLLIFEEAINDVNNSANCEKLCLPNCEETMYEYTIDSTELDTEKLCKKEETLRVCDNIVSIR
jgi:hypothetical protein